MQFNTLLEKLLNKEDLTTAEAEAIMLQTMQGELTPVQVAGWLVALRAKGETPDEITAAARIMRSKATALPGLENPLVDTCGTGGDKSSLMNISTLAALLIASKGIKVAKHGNRSVSSKSGSADILEKLGYPMNETPEQTAGRIKEKNFGFMFAPLYHPAMKHAIGARKELAIRTIFNILGPLSNPAGAEIHLLGVFTDQLLKPMATALSGLGVKQALVVHSTDGLDEISPVADTRFVYIDNGSVAEGTISVASLGLTIKSLAEIQVNDADDALAKTKQVLDGTLQPAIEAVALNSAALEYLYKKYQGESIELEKFLSDTVSENIDYLKAGKLADYVAGW